MEFSWSPNKQSFYYVLLVFTVAFVVRTIPELLMGPYIAGFDQMGYYIPIVYSWVEDGANFWHITASAPLLYSILVSSIKLGFPLVLTLKLLAPVLHGLLSMSIYMYAHKSLNWSCKKSLAVALFTTVYFVGLRASWDMFRVQLGLIFIFSSLTFLGFKTFKSRLFASLSIFMVSLSNQYTAVVMFSIIFFFMLKSILHKEFKQLFSFGVISIPGAVFFIVSLYANAVISSTFISEQIGFPTLINNDWLGLFGFFSYPALLIDTGLFIVFCYVLLLPLIIRGFKTLDVFELKSWTIFGLIAAFSPILFSVSRYRWVLLLIYPLSFYSIEGASKIFASPRRNYLKVLSAFLVLLSVSFLILPAELNCPYYQIFPYYVPTSMVQNTVPLSDCPDVENSLNWLNENAGVNSYVIAHVAFYGWAQLYLDENITIKTYGYGTPDLLAESISQNGFVDVYLVWWINGSGLHGQPFVSEAFKELYRSNDIAVYNYVSQDFV